MWLLPVFVKFASSHCPTCKACGCLLAAYHGAAPFTHLAKLFIHNLIGQMIERATDIWLCLSFSKKSALIHFNFICYFSLKLNAIMSGLYFFILFGKHCSETSRWKLYRKSDKTLRNIIFNNKMNILRRNSSFVYFYIYVL